MLSVIKPQRIRVSPKNRFDELVTKSYSIYQAQLARSLCDEHLLLRGQHFK